MKAVFKVIIFLAVIIALLLAGRNIIAKVAVEKGVQAAMGVSLSIAKLDLGLTSTHIGISDLSLYNPKGFKDKIMFHAPEIFVDYDLGAMITGKVHLEDIRLDFDQLVIVTNEKGETNLSALKPKAKEGQPQRGSEDKSASEGKKPSIQIDHLMLKVGTVIYKDYSKGGEPIVKEYKVNISEEISNVTDPNSLLSFIATKALMKTSLSTLGDFNVNVDGASSQAIDALKSKAEMLGGKIKLPFGQ